MKFFIYDIFSPKVCWYMMAHWKHVMDVCVSYGQKKKRRRDLLWSLKRFPGGTQFKSSRSHVLHTSDARDLLMTKNIPTIAPNHLHLHSLPETIYSRNNTTKSISKSMTSPLWFVWRFETRWEKGVGSGKCQDEFNQYLIEHVLNHVPYKMNGKQKIVE